MSNTIWAVDGSFFAQRLSGIQRYSIELLAALDRIVPPGFVEIVTPPGVETPHYTNIKVVPFGTHRGGVWQQLDYIKTIYEFKDRIFHVHFKDIKLYPEKLAECGVLAYPLDYMSPKIPGLGDVNWSAFVSALNDIRYNGCAVIEVEDKAFEGSREDILNSIRLSKRYLDNFLI